MGLLLIIPDPLLPELRTLRESVDMLTRLQARLRTLERVNGCDTASLHQKLAEVEGAIKGTQRACNEVWPTLLNAAPPAPLPMEPPAFPPVGMGEGGSAPYGEQHVTASA